MKRVALLLIASFLGSVAILPAAAEQETSVPTQKVAKRYKSGKKARRSKANYRRHKRKAHRRTHVV